MNDFDFYINNLLEPSRKSWKIQESHEWINLTAPNGTSFTFLLDQSIDFSQEFDLQPQSARMWLWSLGYIPLLTDKIFKNKIIKEFLLFFKSDKWAELSLKSSSMDHCAAVRIRSLCHDFCLGDFESDYFIDLKEIVTRSCEYAVRPSSLVKNNHGMMLSFALLHAVEILNLNDIYRETANNFLKLLFSEVFDIDGMSNENTIGYHDFYCKTLAQLSLFLVNFSDDLEFIEYIESLKSKAATALYKSVWPDGGLPPIGESSPYPTKYRSLNGIHFFYESGLFVKKDEDFYFSIVGGSRGETHKQMDDGSFTLKYKGVQFITDGGLYNYDRHDPFRRYFNSQRSHSGFYFSEFDSLIRPEFIQKNKGYSCRSEWSEFLGRFTVTMNYSSEVSTRRIFNFISDKQIKITDVILSGGGLVSSRFLVPNNLKIHHESGLIILLSANCRVTIQYPAGCAFCIFSALRDPYPEGWISTGFNKKEIAKYIEITGDLDSYVNDLDFYITLFDDQAVS